MTKSSKILSELREKVSVLNGTIAGSVVLDITSSGVDNEIFSDMKFDIFIDDIHIGIVPGKGTTTYETTPGRHYIKIGASGIHIDIPRGETFVKLVFIWRPSIEQQIVCQQSQFVTKSSVSETAVSKTAPNKKQRILIAGLVSITAVFAIAVVAAIISGREAHVPLESEYSSDRGSDKNDNNGTTEISDQSSTAVGEAEVRKAYAEKVQELASQDSTLLFDLIDLDGDDVLELVADREGYDVSVFTWINGKIITLMDEWPYGAMGNHGYGYLPGRNVIYNYDMDQGGAIIYETYWAVNRYNEVAMLSGETLTICHFNDANRNGMIDEDEEFSDEPYYYYGNAEITEEEYESYQFQGEYDWISGDKTCEEILRLLNEEN